ncbi:hypothetical protein GCM10027446_07440 [Angustibacter peucedani]
MTWGRPDRRAAWLALDVVAVLAFAAVGRRSHEEGVTAAGALATAAPFLVGVLAGWCATRAWERPSAVRPTGLAVWVLAVVVGMVGRRLVDEGTAPSFVVVATVVLAAMLLGWRLVVRLVGRWRAT